MTSTVTTWHLEILDPAKLRPARAPRAAMEIRRAETICPELNRFLYTAVGGDWYWIDRLGWSRARWLEWLDRPEVETWVGSIGGNPVGYYELEQDPAQGCEVAYFGVLPQWVGQGLGGVLLTHAIRRGFERGAARVWVHTCSLDHPTALAHYQARGFEVFKIEREEKELPGRSPGPWPGA